ncbi:MAG: sugar phosphate isomerase/epimerase [Pseudomonadota bacterium]
MRLGFNMLLWTTHVSTDHSPTFEALKGAGYDGVEIPLFEGDVAHFETVGKRLAELELGVTTVTVMPPGKNCISADAAEREAGLGHLQWAIECTNALGGELVAGPFHQPLAEFSGTGPTADEVSRCVEVHAKAAAFAAERNIKLSVEPLNRFECYFLNTAEQAASLVRKVGAENYGYLYDTFHLNIEENDPIGVIAKTASCINHVHISENTRGTPGDGHIDFHGTIAALVDAGYDGWLTVEAFGSALPDLAAATKIWRTMFERPEDVHDGAIRTMRAGVSAARG